MNVHRLRTTFPLALALAGAVVVAGPARADHADDAAPDHLMLAPAQLTWTEGPASLPPGAKMAILEGNPSAAGPFTFRAQLPAGYRIPAHHHPQVEHVTVISGAFHMGVGDKLDTSKGTALPPGGFAVMAIGTRHYAWTEDPTVIQVHGIGPWGITYVDPATDPRNK